MWIDVDCAETSPTVRLRDADEFDAFKLVVRAADTRGQLVDALRRIGSLDGDGNALVSIDALVDLAGRRAADPDWRRSFDRMVEFARSRGWTDARGSMLQAHCEWLP